MPNINSPLLASGVIKIHPGLLLMYAPAWVNTGVSCGSEKAGTVQTISRRLHVIWQPTCTLFYQMKRLLQLVWKFRDKALLAQNLRP